MKNIYLVTLIIIAFAILILGMVLFIVQKRNPQTANPQVETIQQQNEGTESGALPSRELTPEELRQLEEESTSPASVAE